MSTREYQARWRAEHAEHYRDYMREYMRARYRRLHPTRAAPTLAQRFALADLRALGGWNLAERSVRPEELVPSTKNVNIDRD